MSPAYRELPPPPALARHVACFWYQTVGDRSVVHRVVPDACSDIVVFEGEAPTAVGPATTTALVTLPAGGVIVGARFRPGMVQTGFGVPASELLDVDTPLDTIWKPALVRELGQRLADARSIASKLVALEALLVRRLAERQPVDARVEAAVRRIAGSPGAPVGAVLSSTGLGDLGQRQVLRRFRDSVGYGPKTLQRVLRFQRLLVLSADKPAPLGTLALDAGYVDQPHMTREVRALSGETPRQLLSRSWSPSAMSDFFKTADTGGR